MSLTSVALAAQPTLADLLDEVVTDALEGDPVSCLWCGATATVAAADRFTGRTVVCCPACGSELEAVRPRRRSEARA